MARRPVHQVYGIEPTSGFARAGLIFSALGWLTCGLLCIPGAFLSFAALFDRGPKGTAIAGLIIGFPGVAFFILVGLGMIAAVFAPGFVAYNEPAPARSNVIVSESIDTALAPDEEQDHEREDAEEQADQQRDALYAEWIEENPAPEEPTFETETWYSDGLNTKTEGTFVSADATSVTIRKLDGTEVKVDRERLSASSIGMVDEHFRVVVEFESKWHEWKERSDAEEVRIAVMEL
ncbi:MAG: DUF4190 domain-containing protein [Planctomycetota bacterium]